MVRKILIGIAIVLVTLVVGVFILGRYFADDLIHNLEEKKQLTQDVSDMNMLKLALTNYAIEGQCFPEHLSEVVGQQNITLYADKPTEKFGYVSKCTDTEQLVHVWVNLSKKSSILDSDADYNSLHLKRGFDASNPAREACAQGVNDCLYDFLITI